MKVLCASDLHMESRSFRHGTYHMDAADADLVVLAGDIDEGFSGFVWACNLAEKHRVPVVYVAGNHEYWHSSLPLRFKLREEAERQRKRGCPVWFLERDVAFIPVAHSVVRILGATLWSDFTLFGEEGRDEAMETAAKHMPDYRFIGTHPWKWWQKLHPRDTLKLCEDTIHWMWEEAVHPYEHGPTIFVTHNAPSFQSIASQYEDHILSPVFSSNFEELIDFAHVSLWVHGHVHHSADYEIHNTRVVCNPLGYNDDVNLDFNPRLFAEL